MRFEIGFTGHENIRSNHQKTIEITKEPGLTPRGDCIVGVNATHACADLPDELKGRLRDPAATVTITIEAGPHRITVTGRGHPGLVLEHGHDIVIRKSDFVCPRTMAVRCDKASDLLPREMVSLLQDPQSRGTLTVSV